MIPKGLIEKLVKNDIYIYIRHIDKEFAGVIEEITEENLVILRDRNNNLVHIPIDLIDVLTDRR
ncbi:MAG: hypothetical protein GF383_02715 [Candidatus Lokiarchaeota archaeon]|nr:hypothetical protein [Candidatus Lokiarchaeota archaeon]